MKKFIKSIYLTFIYLLLFSASFAQNITIKGRVKDNGNLPIPSASVVLKGTKNGVQTDVNGNYSISVPAKGGILVFSYVGFSSKEIAINNQTNIDVTLSVAVQDLSQIVVVGYGTQKKIDVTGAVGTVKGDELAKQASINPISSLQGKVAGVNITNNGAPGSAPKITIRGAGTIHGNTGVLYVVDGVWYNDISFINPDDIDNLSILKDASAQSIFGIRAANGVVLITTKKGKSGSVAINYNGSYGYKKATNQVKMANATEYATIINELSAYNKSPALFSDPSKFGEGTNWYNQILQNAMTTNHNLSVNGGSEKSVYNFSLGYLNEDGIIKTNNYQRYTMRLTNDFQLFKNLKMGYSAAGTGVKEKAISNAIFRQMYTAGPVVPVRYQDGAYGDPQDFKLGGGNDFNPQVTIDFSNLNTKKYFFNGNIYGELTFLKDFKFKISAGGEFIHDEFRNYQPVYQATEAQKREKSVLSLNKSQDKNWLIENTLTYNKVINEHNFTVLAGQSAQRRKFYKVENTVENVPNFSEGDFYLSLGNNGNVSDRGSLSTYASYFGRLNYSFKNRYMLTASLRSDGASQFFNGSNLWGYFPSVGLGWVISEENFMKNQNIFNNLKLRASWGLIGNAGVPVNPTTAVISQDPRYTAIFNNKAYPGANQTNIPAPFLNWEKSEGADIGLEMFFLNNRLSADLDFYSRTTKDAIFPVPILGSLGTSSSEIIQNQAEIRNRGIEALIKWTDKTPSGFSYTLNGNISYNQNKVTKVLSGSNPIYGGGNGITSGNLATITVLGRSIGEYYGYQVVGVFQNRQQVAESAQKDASPGDFIYVDQNGDGVIDGKDRVSLGNPNPKFTYGFNVNMAYKNFDLSFDLQGVAGVQIYNANIAYRYGNENFSKNFYDNRWHGEGTSNTYPSAKIGSDKNSAPNSFYVENGSYIRLRNIQLGYSLSQNLMKNWKMQRFRFFLDTQNPINIFKYKGFSPEVGGGPTQSGLDANVYPLSATYRFGINVTF